MEKQTSFLVERLFYYKILVTMKVSSTGGESLERKRQARWDAGHLRTVTTKLPRREYLDFRVQCLAAGETPYSLMKRLLKDWMETQRP